MNQSCKTCKPRSSRRIKIGEDTVRVDKCLTNIVLKINEEADYETIGSCCGHGRYPMSVVVKDQLPEVVNSI